MSMPPEHLPDDPQQLLGDGLWDRLGEAQAPPVPSGFDARFRAELRSGKPWYRRHWVPISAGVAAFAAAAAGLTIALRPPVATVEPLPLPADDLALVAELELVENLELLEDLETLMAWDGTTP